MNLDEVVESNTLIFKTELSNIQYITEDKLSLVIADIPVFSLVEPLNIQFSVHLKGIKHQRIIPVIKDNEGNLIGSFSPILKASGLEFALEVNRQYIFFAEPHPKMEDGYMYVFRIEPIDKENQVKEILKNKKGLKK